MARTRIGIARRGNEADVNEAPRRIDLKHDAPQTRTSSSSIVERIIELEILPGLAALHPQSPPAKAATTGEEPTSRDFGGDKVEELAIALLSTEPALALDLVDDLFERGVSRQTLFGEVLADTARRLGELWEQDACSFVDVTVGLNRLHQILREHAILNPPQPGAPHKTPRSIFLMPAPGEQHIFGMLILADHFRGQGWRVDMEFSYQMGADELSMVTLQEYGCLGFTISNHRCTKQLTDIVSTLRNTPEWGNRPIMIGGSLIDTDSTLIARVGADASARNEIDALTVAETLIGVPKQREPSDIR